MLSLRGFQEGQCLIWETKKPYEDRTRKSPVFWFQGCESYFELVLVSSPHNTKKDSYDLYKRRPGDQNTDIPPSDLSIYIMVEERLQSICLLRRNYDRSEKIGSFPVYEMVQKVGNFLSHRTMQLVIIFHGNGELKLDNSKEAQCYRNLSSLEQLSSDFSKLLDDDSDKDVQLNCGHQTVKAHRNILSARSRVFQAMLQRSNMAEARTGVVEIQDMEEDVFQKFIRYLYTGKLTEVSDEEARRLYEIADKYEVEKLMRLGANVLIKSLTLDNACEILTLADAHADQQLKEGVINYMVDSKIPLRDDQWMPFSDSHPKLALEVVNRAYKSQNFKQEQ